MHPIILTSLTIAKNAVEKVETDKHVVFIDKEGNRFLHTKDNEFNMLFRKSDGFTVKWSKTLEEDPTHSPIAMEIFDMEITTACNGIRWEDGKRKCCPWCYKSLTPNGLHMSFEKFKIIFEKLNKEKTLTQIAFGVDAQCKTNPDVWKIFEHTKNNGVTPNVTVADIDQETAEKIVSYCGATAVSAYSTNKNCCYDTVKLLVDEAKKQNKKMAVNIHAMISEETIDFVNEVVDDSKKDDRLSGLNAIVFLSLKQKGRGETFHRLSDEKFKALVDRCLELGISFGFDSCGCKKFIDAIKERPNAKELEQMSESCESLNFSGYCNENGEFFPCSFMEKEGEWEKGIDLTSIEDFSKDVWNGDPRVIKWRENSIKQIKCTGCNSCPYYNV